MRLEVCVRNDSKCVNCGFCTEFIQCPSPEACIGCLSCYRGCPYEAIEIIEDKSHRRRIKIVVDGQEYEVPERITVKKALEIIGYSISKFPEENKLFFPCEVGACYSCVMMINKEPQRACITPVQDGMVIETRISDDYVPVRPIHGPEGHPVGGVGTPWWMKERGRYIEVAIWAAGCNLSCPQCQNYHITYDSKSKAYTPKEVALILTWARKKYGVDRMAISGGEPTINRRWLVEFFKELRNLNKDDKARFHLDTNATILTKDYIDELVLEAGVTDIGPDLKGLNVETFMQITGISDKELAERYLETSWKAVRYIADQYYPEHVFMGIGIPYNKAFISLDEIYKMGLRIASINPEIQVCVLDYFPAFRRRDIERPSYWEMLRVKRTLEDAGCKTVIAQTIYGHVGPGEL